MNRTMSPPQESVSQQSRTAATDGQPESEVTWQARSDLIASAVVVVVGAVALLILADWLWASLWLAGSFAIAVALAAMLRRELPDRVNSDRTATIAAAPDLANRPLSVPAPAVNTHAFDLGDLELVFAAHHADGQHSLVASARLNSETVSFVVVNTAGRLSADELRPAMRWAFDQSNTPHRAAARMLHVLEKDGRLGTALTGIWYPVPRVLAYVSVGLDEAVVFRSSPGRPWDFPAWRSRRTGLPTFRGLHRLERGERWLLFSPSLTEVPDPMRRPFGRVAIAQYGHDDRAMSPRQWTEYLLTRGLAAHGGRLPAGAALICLACSLRPSDASLPEHVYGQSQRGLVLAGGWTANEQQRAAALPVALRRITVE